MDPNNTASKKVAWIVVKYEWYENQCMGYKRKTRLQNGHVKRKSCLQKEESNFNAHQRSVLMPGINVIQQPQIYRRPVTVTIPGGQGVFLHLHYSLFPYASSCFSLSSANNARVLFLFEKATWVPIGHEGGRVEMEAVTVRDGDIGLGEPY